MEWSTSEQELAESVVELSRMFKKLQHQEEGCPWVREQTHHSLKNYLIEEAYETLQAIDESSLKLYDELGDILLQVLFHASVAEKEGRFSLKEVVSALTNKLLIRNPHVFGNMLPEEKPKSAAEVGAHWEAGKEKQGMKRSLSSIGKGLPALLRAQKLGDEVASKGFIHKDVEEQLTHLSSEIEEFIEETHKTPPDRQALEGELGDMLFLVARLGSWYGVNAEAALTASIQKFLLRFERIEQLSGKRYVDLSPEELGVFWKAVKVQEKKSSTPS